MLAGSKGSRLGRGNTWTTLKLQQKLQPHPAGMAFQRCHSFLIKGQDFELHISWIRDALLPFLSEKVMTLGKAADITQGGLSGIQPLANHLHKLPSWGK